MKWSFAFFATFSDRANYTCVLILTFLGRNNGFCDLWNVSWSNTFISALFGMSPGRSKSTMRSLGCYPTDDGRLLHFLNNGPTPPFVSPPEQLTVSLESEQSVSSRHLVIM